MIDSPIPKCELDDVKSAAKKMSQDKPQSRRSTASVPDRSSPREKKSRYSNTGLHSNDQNRQKHTSQGNNVFEGLHDFPDCSTPLETVVKVEVTDDMCTPYLDNKKTIMPFIPIVDTGRIETTLSQFGENKTVNTSRKAPAIRKNIRRRVHEDNDVSDFDEELFTEKYQKKKRPLDPRHRLRNAKFTAHENMVLVENLLPVFHKLAGDNLATTDPAWKHAAWLKITAAINSLGVYPRHHSHVKKRFHDIKFTLRKKMIDEQKFRKSGIGVSGKKKYYHDYEELLKPYIFKKLLIEKPVKEQPVLMYSENSSESGLSVTAQGLDTEDEDTTNMESSITFCRPHPDGNCTAAEPFTNCSNSVAPESTGIAECNATDAAFVPPAFTLHKVKCENDIDHPQPVFDGPQSERLQDKQKSHRKVLTNRLDVLNDHLAKFNTLFEQQIATTQMYRQQQLDFMCKQNELLTEQISKLDSIASLLGERSSSSNISNTSV